MLQWRVNWSVGSIRGWSFSVAGGINKDGHWVLIQRVRDGGPDIQGIRAFIWSCLDCGRRRDKDGVGCGYGILLGGHGSLREIKV